MRFFSNLISSTLGTLLAFGIVFFFVFLFVLALAATSEQAPSVRSGSVLVIPFSGDVPELVSDDPFAQVFSDGPRFDLRDVKMALRKAAADERIEGVWLQMRGLGASWATLEEIRAALLEFKESGKPLIASSDDYYMDETGYFLASAADSVFAAPQALFEFNGFYLNAEFYKKLLDKLDIDPQIVRAGKFKGAVEPFLREDLSPENREQLTMLLDSWNDVFLNAVSESRKMPVEKLHEIAEASAIFSAEDGLKAGLLDRLLYKDEIADLFKRRLGKDVEEDLEQVNISAYKRVPASEAGLDIGGDDDIAVVYAVGAITSGDSGLDPNPLFGGEALGAETFAEAMRDAQESDKVKAIVVRINSPGGSAPAADAMWRAMSLAAAAKPVIVSMGDVAASGGYWMATAADTIVADPLTITGSIGVFALMFDAGGLFENKLGVTFDAVRTSPYADMFSGVRPLSPQEQALLERSTQETYRAFLERVAEGVGLDVIQADSVGQGRIWSGLQAKEIGLVHELGGLERAIEIAAEKAGLEEGAYGTRILPRPKTMVERITENLNTRAANAIIRIRTSPTERRMLEQAGALRRALDMQRTVQAWMPLRLEIR